MSVRARVSRRWQGDVELIKILNMCNDEPDLGAPNELQNTPAYLAILFDRPEARRRARAPRARAPSARAPYGASAKPTRPT